MKLNQVLAGLAVGAALASAAVAQPYGAGHSMAGGYAGGHGMGSGMMGHGHGHGMDPGMVFGYTTDAYAGLGLTPAQQKTIADIQAQSARAMWQHLGEMHGQGYRMQGMFRSGPMDEAAARKSFQAMAEAQQAMFESQLDARKQVDAVLTQDQRDTLSRRWSGR